MLTTTLSPGTNVVTIEFDGHLDAAEMAACHDALEKVVAEYGTIRLLARYGEIDLRHVEPRALWEDLKNIPLIRHVDRCAIVANQDWVRKVSDAAAVVLPCEVKTYHVDELEAARAWVEA